MRNVVNNYGWVSGDETDAHKYITPAILNELSNISVRKVLDLGCGNGVLAGEINSLGYDVTGIDADYEGIQYAKSKNPTVNFLQHSIYEDLPDINKIKFNVVVSSEVIEHLFLPRFLPKFAFSVLDDDGYLIITTPYHGYLKNLAISVMNKWDKHLDPFWDGGHIKLWSRKTLTKLLQEHGFTVLSFKGLGRFPYMWKSMLIVAKKV